MIDMELKDLAFLVFAMRHHQKKYFQTRSKEELIASKENEAIVDKYVGKILEDAEIEARNRSANNEWN